MKHKHHLAALKNLIDSISPKLICASMVADSLARQDELPDSLRSYLDMMSDEVHSYGLDLVDYSSTIEKALKNEDENKN